MVDAGRIASWLAIAIAAGCTGGCVKNVAPSPSPQTQAFFPCPAAEVFKATVHVIEYDELLPIEIRDEARMFLSTKEIRETTPQGPIKSRLSATVRADESGANLRIYRDLHSMRNGSWKTIDSDHVLEQRLIRQISARLSGCE